jgi:HPt (histidine-containing phosphotransfer) domain-containing protein
VQTGDPSVVLDREQLRDITMNDLDLMREVLSALVDDTSRQLPLLESAIRERNAERCMHLAHYSKGACANVGANGAAALLKHIERKAAGHEFADCLESLVHLAIEIERLRQEI